MSEFSTTNLYQRSINSSSKDQFTMKSLQQAKLKITQEIEDKKAKDQQLIKNYNVVNFNNQQYSYTQVDTNILQSEFTDKIAKFQVCVQLIQNYNKEIAICKQKQKEIIAGPWKNVFYGTLQNLLMEVKYTKNRVLQQAFAQKTAEWAEYQLSLLKKGKQDPSQIKGLQFNPNSLRTKRSVTGQSNSTQGNANDTTMLPTLTNANTTRIDSARGNSMNKSGQSFNKTARNILGDVSIQPKREGRSQSNMIPSDQITITKQDYNNGHRTQHKEYDPPCDVIAKYNYKRITFQEPVPDQVDPTQIEGDVTYPKPPTYIPQKEMFDFDELQNQMNDGNADAQDEDDVEKGDDELQSEQAEQNEPKMEELLVGIDGEKKNQAKPEPPMHMVPATKNFIKDSMAKQDYNPDMNKKYEQRSTYNHYKPSDHLAEGRMEQKWLENRQKEVSQKRQEEELIKQVNVWAATKGKMEKEFNRRYEQKIYGSNLEQCEYKPKQYEKSEVESLIKEAKISEAEEKEREDKRIAQEKLEEELQAELEKQDSKQNTTQKNNPYQKSNTVLQQPSDLESSQKFNKRPVRTIKSFSMHGTGSLNQTSEAKVFDITGQLPQIARKDRVFESIKNTGLEKDINNKKVGNLRQQYGNLIGIGFPKRSQKENDDESEYEEPQKVVCQPSLSVYSRPIKQKHRPFSSVFDIANRESVRDQQIKEIQDLKNRLAKHEISVPLKKLMDSMVVPEHFIGSELNIPEPGTSLMMNPFFSVGKKKKKKKGRK